MNMREVAGGINGFAANTPVGLVPPRYGLPLHYRNNGQGKRKDKDK